VFTDLTGSFADWTNSFRGFLKSREADISALCNFLAGLEPCDAPSIVADTVISLNLIGQIGALWRSRVNDMIRMHWGGSRPWVLAGKVAKSRLSKTLNGIARKIELQHLQLLCRSARRHIILTSDTFNNYPSDASGEPVEPVEVLGFDWRALELDGFELRSTRDWKWDLCPVGIEYPHHAVVNDVRGWHFVRK
jgi:hypothetical protein